MVFLLILYIAVGFAAAVAQKHSSNTIAPDGTKPTSQVYLIITAIVSCAFFFVSGGFTLKINVYSLLCSIVFAVIAILSNILVLVVYRYFDIAQVTIIDGIGSILLTTVLGVVVFKETLTWVVLVKCALMIVAVVLSFLSKRKSKINFKKIRYLLYMTIVTALVWLLLKIYSGNEQAVPNSSLCFFANVFMLIFSSIWLLINIKRSGNTFEIKSLNFGKRELIATLFAIVSNNGLTLLNMVLVTKMDMVLITPITTALTIVTGAISSLVYKEKLNVYSIISIVLSCAVIFIG